MTPAAPDFERLRAQLVAAAGRFEVLATPDGFLVRDDPVTGLVADTLIRLLGDGLLAFADDRIESFVLPTLTATSLVVNGVPK